MKNIVAVVWWPHSGGRWLSRSLLARHTCVEHTTFIHPWLFNSTDKMLQLDITSQIHKARSMPELKRNLDILRASTDEGRLVGLREYFNGFKHNFNTLDPNPTHIVGEICLGSPEPNPLDIDMMFKAFPEIKIIHLIRNPINAFNSFLNRYEMDGDPIKISGSWVTLNAIIRNFIEINEEYGNRYHLVKFEDIERSPKEYLSKICDFIDLDYEEFMIENINERWGKGSNTDVPTHTRNIIKEIAQNEMNFYGYE